LHGDEHVRQYQETDGEDGYNWRNGTTILLLTTTGRKSGKERTHALIYRDYDDKYLIVASKGGSDTPPTWFHNMEADPNVQVQIKGDKFAARARVATPEEKPAMWKHMTEVWPDYDNYQQKTDREIPVVVLERA
jgi:deazaflavin-dependent oxidoreductase (nitroreductase family)